MIVLIYNLVPKSKFSCIVTMYKSRKLAFLQWLMKGKLPLQPISSTLNIQISKLVGSYKNRLSLPFFDRYRGSAPYKSDSKAWKLAVKMGTHRYCRRSWAPYVCPNLEIDLAAQIYH